MAERPSSQAIRDFLGEAEEIIEKLNLDLVTLGDGTESGEVDPETLNSIFRGAHSIKGISGMFGFDDISALAHHMENLLDSLRLGKIPFNGVLVETLFEGLESLTRLVHGKNEAEEYSLDVGPVIARIEAVLDGARGEKPNPLAGLNIDSGILNVLTEYEEHRLLENLKKGRRLLRVKATFPLTSFDQELAVLSDTLKKGGEVISTLPFGGRFPTILPFRYFSGPLRVRRKSPPPLKTTRLRLSASVKNRLNQVLSLPRTTGTNKRRLPPQTLRKEALRCAPSAGRSGWISTSSTP